MDVARIFVFIRKTNFMHNLKRKYHRFMFVSESSKNFYYSELVFFFFYFHKPSAIEVCTRNKLKNRYYGRFSGRYFKTME